MAKLENLQKYDQEIFSLINQELTRQREGLEMIASENFTHPAVMEAMGTVLTNKYAEGYPQKRYYGGNEIIDKVEQLAIDRLKKLFNAEHANVQPHSGSQANAAAYLAILNPGDKILAMDLSAGGHLTHGAKVNFSGRFYNIISYGVNQEGYIDYDELEKTALEEKPKLILAGASAYPRIIDFERLYNISEKIQAYFMVDMAHIAGLVATDLHPDPVKYADIVTSTTHKTLAGPRSGFILCKQKDRWKDVYTPDSKKNLAQKIDSAVFPGTQGGPLEHVIAAKAVGFKYNLSDEFKTYSKQIIDNTQILAKKLIAEGFNLVSGGTDNHLVLINLSNLDISGKQAEQALEEVGIYVNKNMVPNDQRSPFDPSGIRLGTPALTSRGLKEKDLEIVGQIISQTLKNLNNSEIMNQSKQLVKELTDKYPLYPEINY